MAGDVARLSMTEGGTERRSRVACDITEPYVALRVIGTYHVMEKPCKNLEKPWKNHAYHAVKMKKSQTMEWLPGIKDKYTNDRKRWRENYLVMDACDTPLVQVRPSQFSKLQTQSVLACSAWDAMYNLVLGAPSEPVSCAHTHFCKRRSLGKERLVEDICQLSHLRLHQVSKWQNVGVTWGNMKLDDPTMSPYTTLTVLQYLDLWPVQVWLDKLLLRAVLSCHQCHCNAAAPMVDSKDKGKRAKRRRAKPCNSDCLLAGFCNTCQWPAMGNCHCSHSVKAMQWPFAYSQGHKARQANPKRPARAAASVLLMPCAGDPLELDWASKLGSENMLSIAIHIYPFWRPLVNHQFRFFHRTLGGLHPIFRPWKPWLQPGLSSGLDGCQHLQQSSMMVSLGQTTSQSLQPAGIPDSAAVCTCSWCRCIQYICFIFIHIPW